MMMVLVMVLIMVLIMVLMMMLMTVLIMVVVSVVTMVPVMMMMMMSMMFVVGGLELSRLFSAVDIHGLLLLGLVGLRLLDQTHACREREKRDLGCWQLHPCRLGSGGSIEKKGRVGGWWYKI